MIPQPVVFVWPGDLHLEFPDRENYQTALWMADEVSTLIKPDFVQFAGDNVQHARDSEFDLFRDVYSKLKVPFYALVGDHDAHHDPGCQAYQARMGETYKAFSKNGYRFILLNTMQFRPLGMTDEQVIWFRYEVDSALARDEKVVVFQHHYPFQVWEDFAGPGLEGWREIVQTRPIHAVFAGHTHYGQVANDGRNIYFATRSIGEPEGGPAGYAVVHLEGEDLAAVYRSVEDKGLLAMIVHPRRLILATRPAHIISGKDECRVRVWSTEKISSVKMRIDSGPFESMKSAGDGNWIAPIPGDTLPKGEHRLEVQVTGAGKTVGSDSLVFLVDRSGRYNAYPTVEPIVTETKFC